MYSSDLDLITKAQLEQQHPEYGFLTYAPQAREEGQTWHFGRVLAWLGEHLPQPQHRHVAGS